MALKHDLKKAFRAAGRVVPKILGDILIDLDARLTAVEGKELDDRLEIVDVNVSATNTNGSSAADEALIDAIVLGVVSVGNQDQFVDNVAVGEDGKVTVSLADAATAQNQFKVSVLKVLPT